MMLKRRFTQGLTVGGLGLIAIVLGAGAGRADPAVPPPIPAPPPVPAAGVSGDMRQ
jgi:hypothetical protein